MNIQVQPNTTLNNKTGGWRTLRPNFLHDKCTACAICQRLCPEGIIHQTNQANAAGKKYFDCDLDYCKGCGLCADVCPFKAIVMEVDEK
ncbi:MAG: 4Fe-4S binding protein [Patescibacteria group bacterium]|nr:4Fe-4S binding protein [Patescibacteria group bacterium]